MNRAVLSRAPRFSGLTDWLAMAMLPVMLLGMQTPSLDAAVYRVAPTADAQFVLQGRLIEAVPGDVIQLEAGTYRLRRQLDVVADNVTIRGQGSSKTVLSFRDQDAGGQGIEATGDNFVLEGLAVEDTVGNAIKVNGARNVTFRDVRVEWTGPPQSSNGAYGLYPVQCENVLIERCTAIGASDAGLYVGQCRNVVVRDSRAERNVAGIEIENTIAADVYDNVATNNAGGLLVFDLPGLQQTAGRQVRVFRNRVFANNHRNFAAPGNIVAGVPSGTGLMVMATDAVEVFENEIRDNQTSGVSIVSYYISGKKLKHTDFDPVPEGISIHDNVITGGGTNPQGAIRRLLSPVLGESFPDILYDGVQNPARFVDGKLPVELGISVRNNGGATFANFNLPKLQQNEADVRRDLADVDVDIPPLPKVTLKPHDAAGDSTNPRVLAYREAPRMLSGWQLFTGDGASQEPAAGVVPYDLNTPLFSDYTRKRRFIRIPAGTQIDYEPEAVFTFPVGTVIAKTFSYPHDMRKPEAGERLLETRIETRREDGWFGYSYVWNESQSDAELLLGGGEVDVEWIHTDGQKRANRYQIPNANQCLNCHNQHHDFVPLGPLAANLNKSYPFAHGEENQLAYWKRIGWLAKHPAESPHWPAEGDDSAELDQRARAWLHVNCAHCHNPAGTARTSGLDLQFGQTDPARYGVWKSPVAAGHGTGGREYDIVPGKPDESILLFRLESEDPSVMMPSVARRLVPQEGVELIRAWIAGLPQ